MLAAQAWKMELCVRAVMMETERIVAPILFLPAVMPVTRAWTSARLRIRQMTLAMALLLYQLAALAKCARWILSKMMWPALTEHPDAAQLKQFRLISVHQQPPHDNTSFPLLLLLFV